MRQTNWIKRAHKIATDNGFHDEKYSDKHFVSLIVAELYEAVEAHRENRRADGIQFQENKAKEEFQKSFEKYIKDTMEDEMGEPYGSFRQDIQDLVEKFKKINHSTNKYMI